MSGSTSFSSLARSKLQTAVGSGARDNYSLHRWVLLKNSITRTAPASPGSTAPLTAATTNAIPSTSPASPILSQEDDEDDNYPSDEDSFLFPQSLDVDADSASTADGTASEAQWLDSLLQSLGDDDDNGDTGEEVFPTVDEDEDDYTGLNFTPLSSSDDLLSPQSTPFLSYPPTIYPAFHPPLVRPFSSEEQDRFWYREYRDPLPYLSGDAEGDGNDVHLGGTSMIPPVPDAISDISDDESDAPSSPYVDTPGSSYILPPLGPSPMAAANLHHPVVSVIDPASVPLPLDEHERARPRRQQGYFDSVDSYFYPFELDPQPPEPRTRTHHSHSHLYSSYFRQDC